MRRRGVFQRTVSGVLTLLMILAALGVPATAAGKETQLQLYRNHPGENLPFQAVNLLPGDSVSQTFRLQVSYSGSITVHFRADVRQGYEKLAEVLKCRVSLNDKEIYDGLMADMPESLSTTVKAPEKELEYRITAYLDTSVGNEYMSKELYADFRWWVEKQDQGSLTPPKTGDRFPLVSAALVMGCSGAALVFFWIRRKKGEADGST